MKSKTKHGHARSTHRRASPTYKAWEGMRARCQKVDHKSYPDYGGRGIKVCDSWNGFANFLADMGVRPSGKTLGRKDNDGDYEPSNCEWQTLKEQARNKRTTRYLEFNGERLAVAAWAERLGLSECTITKRIDITKWSVERTLTTPGRRMKNSICEWQADIDAFRAVRSLVT